MDSTNDLNLACVEDSSDSLGILLFDMLTPQVRKFLRSTIDLKPRTLDQRAAFLAQYIRVWTLWNNSCGNPGNRMWFLTGSYHWLQFLIDDLLLDYGGRPYKVHPWIRNEAAQCAQRSRQADVNSSVAQSNTINIPEELMLDRAYVESKLCESVQQYGSNSVHHTTRKSLDLKTNLEKDRLLVEALFRLTEDLARPAFFDKILTEKKRQHIQRGMERTKDGWIASIFNLLPRLTWGNERCSPGPY